MPKRRRPGPQSRGTRRARRRLPLARWFALATVAVVALLYYRPLKSYVETRAALADRAAEVQSLRAERDQLARRLEASETAEALAQRARRIGLVQPGERLFIVKGIDDWRRRNAGRRVPKRH